MPRKMPLDHDVFAAINDGILRIRAKEYRPERHHSSATTRVPAEVRFVMSMRESGFHWRGPAAELLTSLQKLPSGGGSDAIPNEFSGS
jgi:hypothetical protein